MIELDFIKKIYFW